MRVIFLGWCQGNFRKYKKFKFCVSRFPAKTRQKKGSVLFIQKFNLCTCVYGLFAILHKSPNNFDTILISPPLDIDGQCFCCFVFYFNFIIVTILAFKRGFLRDRTQSFADSTKP